MSLYRRLGSAEVNPGHAASAAPCVTLHTHASGGWKIACHTRSRPDMGQTLVRLNASSMQDRVNKGDARPNDINGARLNCRVYEGLRKGDYKANENETYLARTMDITML